MFPNNQNVWDTSHLFWQSVPNNPNNEQEDLYRRDPQMGELGYYLMPPSTPTSPHPTTPLIPGFYGYYSEPPFFPQNIPQTQNTPQTESVPETQAEPTSSKCGRSRRHRKKDETETRAPKNVELWSPKEEFALAQAWLDVPEDETVGNGQDIKVFWRRIREKFFIAMGHGEYRAADSFSGKWTAMRTKVSNFNNIHTNLVNNHRRRSGSSDMDVMTQALADYRVYHGHTFTMVNSWKLLCRPPKWHLVPPFDPTAHRLKRSKSTSTTEPSESDARTTINLNDDFDEFEQPQEQPRLKGSDKSKAATRTRDKSSSKPSDGPSRLEEFKTSLNKIISMKEKRARTKNGETNQERNGISCERLFTSSRG
ncbi:glutathione S-transferase T3-like [Helianthus annuus]|uniref:glutathione S-transferase T3-like n=1 Tax=Helianthus annuus TaxID=4232 RepID=UPI000B907360|nr:glutathione S-transferase T3-like [Helianthus annuus]